MLTQHFLGLFKPHLQPHGKLKVNKPIHIWKAIFEGFPLLQTKFEYIQISGDDVISKNS